MNHVAELDRLAEAFASRSIVAKDCLVFVGIQSGAYKVEIPGCSLAFIEDKCQQFVRTAQDKELRFQDVLGWYSSGL